MFNLFRQPTFAICLFAVSISSLIMFLFQLVTMHVSCELVQKNNLCNFSDATSKVRGDSYSCTMNMKQIDYLFKERKVTIGFDQVMPSIAHSISVSIPKIFQSISSFGMDLLIGIIVFWYSLFV